MSQPEIRTVTAPDVPAIKALADTYELARLENPDAGFLVSGFPLEAYLRFVERADHFLVLEEDEELAGFVLAYSSERIGTDETVNRQVQASMDEPFVLVKQICVRRDRAGRGVARRLYQAVQRRAPERSLLAAVVLEPRNERSIGFHLRLGGHQWLELRAPDGKPRAIFRIDPRPEGE